MDKAECTVFPQRDYTSSEITQQPQKYIVINGQPFIVYL